MKSVEQVIFAFFEDYLKVQKGLRPGSVRSYRDTLKLFLAYVASNCRRPITRLILSDLSAQRVLDFLLMIEVTRRNHVRTRNQRRPLRIRLHGKGDKWRSCPLWPETAELLKKLIADGQGNESSPLFMSRQRKPLTRFGIYKIVKRHTAGLRRSTPEKKYHGVSPHVFRHSTVVGLLEQGVDVTVIRAWLGHVSLETTYRYTESTLRGKMAAVAACLPPVATSVPSRRSDGSHKDEELLKWLDSL
jgi:site-specific recombinase XerD